MIYKTEKIVFKKALTRARKNMSPVKYKSFCQKLLKILEAETPATLSRHANGKTRTPYHKQLRIEAEFKSEGIDRWAEYSKSKQTSK